MNASTPKPLLVVGAGIAGVTAALEAAEAGYEVILVERDPTVGGRVLRSHQYFPKLCPPSCGMEINIRRLERNPRVRVMTSTRVTKSERKGDGWTVTLTQSPMYVNERCTACGECSKVCTGKVKDTFNLGMAEVPAIRLPHPDAWPNRFVLDKSACSSEDLKAIVDACKYDAINLEATEREQVVEVSAIVLATGWKPYPLEKLPELGGGKLADVIANVHMERLAAPAGPTGGKISEALQRAASPEGRFRTMCRLSRREPSTLLLRNLLSRFVEASDLCERTDSRVRSHHVLHRPPHPRT